VEIARDSGIPVIVSLTDFWFLCPRITLVRSDGSLCKYPRDPVGCVLCLKKEKRRYRLPDRWSRGAAGRILSSLWKRNKDTLYRDMQERRRYLTSLLKEVDVAVSPSRFLRSMFESQEMTPQKLLHQRQGVALQSQDKKDMIKENDNLCFGYVGQITKHKGVDTLIKAFKQLRSGSTDPHLKIFGDTEQFPSYTKQLYKLKGKRNDIDFTGPFEHSRWKQVYSEIDVLVVPSLWYVNSPNVVLEAFAAGKPVIASNLGGTPELVKHDENGFLYRSGDVKDLARQMQKVIDQPDIIDSLKRGIRPVKIFQEELSELIEIYFQCSGSL
jgi:glycosyltransferase involved in cell wall biosynthesis